jgi:hypothetical protein
MTTRLTPRSMARPLAAALVLWTAACGTDVVSDRRFECANDDECPDGERCDLDESQKGLCVPSNADSDVVQGDAQGGVDDGDDATQPEGDVTGLDAGDGDASAGDADGSDGVLVDATTGDDAASDGAQEDVDDLPLDATEGGDTEPTGDVDEDTGGPEQQVCTTAGDCDVVALGIADLPCLRAKCEDGFCAVAPAKATPCDDDNPCTLDDRCVGGECSGQAKECQGSGPCETSSCDPTTGECAAAPVVGPCDDGDSCTEGEVCQGTVCSGGTSICGCATVADCPDDGDPCNGIYECVDTGNGSTCQIQPDSVVVCGTSGEGPCVQSVCDPGSGTCKPSLVSGACDDGDSCTIDDLCADGDCLGSAVACDDGNPCTIDSCSGGSCTTAPAAVACDDGDACTTGDDCSTGACVGSPKGCDDGDPCTVDSCDAAGQCTNAFDAGGVCSDGSSCTSGDTCVLGAGCVGVAVDCDDGNGCTEDLCDAQNPPSGWNPAVPASACSYVNLTGACDDGDKCTSGDTCAAGGCQGSAILCPDDGPCSISACDAETGCSLAPSPSGTPCDDDNACTSGDICQGGSCSGPTLICSCQTNGDCDDGDPCNGVETCADGGGGAKSCKPGSPVVCAPSASPCQANACNPSTGACETNATGEGVTCGDDDACVKDRTCKSGECTGVDVECAGTTCLVPTTCDPVSGCLFQPNPVAAACDDGQSCTENDKCNVVTGACEGASLSCGDQNPCTADSCVPGIGCVNEPVVDGTSCEADKDKCTIDTCQAGVCTKKQNVFCNDFVQCTVDSCSALTGSCIHSPDDTKCNDGNDCTSEVCSAKDGCVPTDLDDFLSCSDGDSGTGLDFCASGDCVGASRVVSSVPSVSGCALENLDIVAASEHSGVTYVVSHVTMKTQTISGCTGGPIEHTVLSRLNTSGTLTTIDTVTNMVPTGASGPVVIGYRDSSGSTDGDAMVGLLEANATSLEAASSPLIDGINVADGAWEDRMLNAVAATRTSSGLPLNVQKQWVQVVGRDPVAVASYSNRCSRTGSTDSAPWSCTKSVLPNVVGIKSLNFYGVSLSVESCKDPIKCEAGETQLGSSYLGSVSSTDAFGTVYSSGSNTYTDYLSTASIGADYRGTLAVGSIAFHYGVDGFLQRCSGGTCTDVSGFSTQDLVDATLFLGEPVFLQTVSATEARLVIRKVDESGTSSTHFWTKDLPMTIGDQVFAIHGSGSTLTVFGWSASSKKLLTWRF